MENFRECPHYETSQNHEQRIQKLEVSDAKMSEKIKSLFDKLDSLLSWIKALVMLLVTSFIGFFFWYIQNLGNKI